MLTVHDLRDGVTEVGIDVGRAIDGHDRLINLLGDAHSEATAGRHRIVLEPYG